MVGDVGSAHLNAHTKRYCEKKVKPCKSVFTAKTV